MRRLLPPGSVKSARRRRGATFLNRQPLLETAAIYAARRRPFAGKSVEAPAVDLNEPVRRILDVATRRQQLLPAIAPLVEERDARATTGCDAALGAVMAVAAQRNEARLVAAQQRLEALATAAERAAAEQAAAEREEKAAAAGAAVPPLTFLALSCPENSAFFRKKLANVRENSEKTC